MDLQSVLEKIYKKVKTKISRGMEAVQPRKTEGKTTKAARNSDITRCSI